MKDKNIPLSLAHEDNFEPGGYFIINGLEKILRTIIVKRKNFAFGIKRANFSNLRKNFTNSAIEIKSASYAYKS